MSKPKIKSSRAAAKNALFPALFAVGGSMAAGSAGALELGDIQVESALGQPLRASIAFALGPNESLQKYCVSVSGASSSSGLPTIANARIDVGDGRITVTSQRAVREPMVSTRLVVNCPYTPNITREYTMFLSPPALPSSTAASSEPAVRGNTVPSRNESRRPVVNRASSNAPRPATAPRPAASISQGQDYRVQPGESLSEIAQRIENRQIRLWPAVNALFEANPDAFINADPNRLKAGSLLTIPTFVGDEVASFAAATPASNTATGSQTAQSTSTTSVDAAESGAAAVETSPTSVAFPEPAAASGTAIQTPAAAGTESQTLTAEQGPAAATVGEESTGSATSVVIPDTAIDDPIPASSTPNRSVARIQPEAVPVEPGTNRMLWTAGGGALLIIGLLMFGRRLREHFGSTPIGAAEATPARRATDHTQTMTATELPVVDVIADDSPTDQNLALDASLGLGHDFDGDVDVDFSENGGMGGTTRLDIELPAADDGETDVISAPSIDTSSILESEVLPDDDDYDMSVIMDMTKMPKPEDVTEKDLKAVEVVTASEAGDDGSYTVNDKIDYDILERDYQDELSATQALNLEIEKAAQELTKRLESEDGDTTNIQIADVEEMDITATVQAQNDATLSDLDDTNVNEALDLDDDDTAVLSADDKTAEMPAPGDSATFEMPQRVHAQSEDNLDAITSDGDHTVEIITRDDDTVEMEIEGGRVNTKRR